MRLPALCAALVVCFLSGCGDTTVEAPVQTPTLHTLQGTVLKKPWTKSVESWNAGGSDYYVLDVGEAAVQRSAEEGVTLKNSEAVQAAAFEAAVGKRVEVEGVYFEAQPYVPSDDTEQYPTDLDGKPLPRGAGFQVKALRLLD